jgi:hypothetical protein
MVHNPNLIFLYRSQFGLTFYGWLMKVISKMDEIIQDHVRDLQFQYYFKNLKVGRGFYAKIRADSDSPHKN